MFRTIAAAALLTLAAAGASHAESLCLAEVNGNEIVIDRDLLGDDAPKASLRERAFNWSASRIDALRGTPPACESELLINFLGTQVAADEVDGYCLMPNEEQGFLLVPGERNFRGRCAKTTCDRVNVAKSTAVDITLKAAGLKETPPQPAETETDPLRGIVHSSGAAILKGGSAYIASSLGSATTGLATALSTPAILAAATVSVVAVGGAVYLCSE